MCLYVCIHVFPVSANGDCINSVYTKYEGKSVLSDTHCHKMTGRYNLITSPLNHLGFDISGHKWEEMSNNMNSLKELQ